MNEIQFILSSYCPDIVDIIGEKKKFWKKVRLKYLDRLSLIKNVTLEKKSYISRRSFLDNLISSKNESDESKAFMLDINYRVKNIYREISSKKELLDKLRSILEQLILPEIDEPKSYDRVGEIYALDYIISLENIEILEMEYKLENGKRIDCLLLNKGKNKKFLIDFLSINIDPEKVESSDGLTKLLLNRILPKYKQKTINLKTIDYSFKVLPIIWIEPELIEKYIGLFKESRTAINEEICTLIMFKSVTDNKYYFTFGQVGG
ncbi:MAG: hypothetical protein JEY96_19315 [Bacteroidales bacterium]|nr:hypothetical protein [Bacteroidales bacterium]